MSSPSWILHPRPSFTFDLGSCIAGPSGYGLHLSASQFAPLVCVLALTSAPPSSCYDPCQSGSTLNVGSYRARAKLAAQPRLDRLKFPELRSCAHATFFAQPRVVATGLPRQQTAQVDQDPSQVVSRLTKVVVPASACRLAKGSDRV